MPSERETLEDDLALLGASVSHDLREPLHIIRLFAQVLAANPEVEEHASHMKAASDQLAGMLDGLTRMVRLGLPEPGPTHLDEVLVRLPEMPVRVVRSGPLPMSAPHLSTVVRELLENAIAHGADPIELSVDGSRLRVDDGGAGIPHPLRARMREPFQTGPEVDRTVHAGVGLTLVDRIARRYGGRLEFTEPPGGGFRTTVSLPEA